MAEADISGPEQAAGRLELPLPLTLGGGDIVTPQQSHTLSGVTREQLLGALSTIGRVIKDSNAIVAFRAVYEDDAGERVRQLSVPDRNNETFQRLSALVLLGYSVATGEPGARERMIDPLDGHTPFSRWLAEKVGESGHKQERIADALGWSPSKMSRLMRDNTGKATEQAAKEAARYFADEEVRAGRMDRSEVAEYVEQVVALRNPRKR